MNNSAIEPIVDIINFAFTVFCGIKNAEINRPKQLGLLANIDTD